MNRNPPAQTFASALALSGALLAAAVVSPAPAAADKLLTLASHSDAMRMMGKTTPAKDETHFYWFGDQGVRFDMGDTSIITRLDQRKFYLIHHQERTFSAIDLPFDFKSIAGPEMAQMMEMMGKQFAATVTVTPSEKSGSFAGIDCRYVRTDVKTAMMTMAIDSCNSDDVPIDFARYKELQESFSQLSPNTDWIKQMMEKSHGFAVRSDSAITVMGSDIKSWSELKTIEDKGAPAGNYDPPVGYKETKFDAMAQMQQRH